MAQTISNRLYAGRKSQNMLGRQIITLAVIVSTFGVVSCNKSRTEPSQLPGQLTTVTNDIKYNSTDVSLSAATKTALDFLRYKNKDQSITLKSAETIVKNGVPYMHIINANKGFVILSADSIYPPLLAYDSAGNFNKSDINTGLRLWINKQAHELSYVRNTKSSRIDSIAAVNKTKWATLGNIGIASSVATSANTNTKGQVITNKFAPTLVSTTVTYAWVEPIVGPFCLTSWAQNYPWNQFCPYDGNTVPNYNGYTAAGCVPVAMAQIMYYWKSPSNYDWQNMALDLNSLSTQAAISAHPIADIGHSYNSIGSQFTTYGDAGPNNTDGSISDIEYAPYIFTHNFNYSSAQSSQSLVTQVLSGGENGGAYKDLLYNEELINQQPCMLSGYPDKTNIGILEYPNGPGHTWVCDGCDHLVNRQITTYLWSNGTTSVVNSDTGYFTLFHMNWGYGTGHNNGWFDSESNYTTTTSGNFQYFQLVTYNIHP